MIVEDLDEIDSREPRQNFLELVVTALATDGTRFSNLVVRYIASPPVNAFFDLPT